MPTDLTPYLTKKIIYFALIVSTFLYGSIVYLLVAEKTPSGTLDEELHQPVILALTALALATFAIAQLLRRLPIVTRWAAIEACCIYGLLATFLTRDWRFFVAGWALALAGFMLTYPRTGEA